MIDSLFGVQPSLSSHNTEVSVCLYCPPVTNIYHPGFCVWPAGKSQSHSATSGCIIQPSGHLRAPELVCGYTSIIYIHSKCACSLSPGWWLFLRTWTHRTASSPVTYASQRRNKNNKSHKVILSNKCAIHITVKSLIYSRLQLGQFGMLDVMHTRRE